LCFLIVSGLFAKFCGVVRNRTKAIQLRASPNPCALPRSPSPSSRAAAALIADPVDWALTLTLIAAAVVADCGDGGEGMSE
jgi:hypothetical protein